MQTRSKPKCYSNLDDNLVSDIKALFRFKMNLIEVGVKYLGFWVKPLNYYLSNWSWMVQKFDTTVSNWSYHLLSLGGRLIPLKSVLSSILVYWFSSYKIPCLILKAIIGIM